MGPDNVIARTITLGCTAAEKSRVYGLYGRVVKYTRGDPITKRHIPFGDCFDINGQPRYLVIVPEVCYIPRDTFVHPSTRVEGDLMDPEDPKEDLVKEGSTYLVYILRYDCTNGTELTVNLGKWYWSQHTNWYDLTAKEKSKCGDYYAISGARDICHFGSDKVAK